MALNARTIKNTGGGDRVEQPHLPAGTYPARLVQVIDLGLQPQKPYEGQSKPPANMVHVTYESSDEFIVDKEGKEVLDKPRWFSEDFPMHNPEKDMATSTKRAKVIDPECKLDFDWSQFIGLPVGVILVANPGKGKNKGRTFNNVVGLSSLRPKDVEGLPELVNEPKVFSLDEPDMEVFNALPQFLQDQIKGNLEFDGSPLFLALNGGEAKAEPKAAPEDGEAW